jgi:sulfur carrier protein
MSLLIILNGQPRTFSELQHPTLDELIFEPGLKGDRVAVEHNGQIVSRATWACTPVHEGDKLEVVHFVGGGSACSADFGS